MVYLYLRTITRITELQNKFQTIKRNEHFYESFKESVKYLDNFQEKIINKNVVVFKNYYIKFVNLSYKIENKIIFKMQTIFLKKQILFNFRRFRDWKDNLNRFNLWSFKKRNRKYLY